MQKRNKLDLSDGFNIGEDNIMEDDFIPEKKKSFKLLYILGVVLLAVIIFIFW